MTANVGLRFDGISGVGANGTEYYSTTGIGPRLGVAIDLTGRASSVLRAFYGQLYSGAVFASWSRAVPGASDFVTYEVLPGNRLVEIDRVPPEDKYTVDPDIKHPRTDEFNIALEQQIFGRMKATATYIRRQSKNFINSVLIDGLWSPVTVNNAKTNQPLTIYRWANRGTQRFNITNVDDVTYVGADGQPIGSSDSTRDYNGLMLVLTRPFQNRWQAQVSYVLSKTEGRVASGGFSGIQSTQFDTPNAVLINRDGLVPLDRRHEFKAFVGYQIPRVEVAFNALYRGVSGTTYTPFQRFTSGTINWTYFGRRPDRGAGHVPDRTAEHRGPAVREGVQRRLQPVRHLRRHRERLQRRDRPDPADAIPERDDLGQSSSSSGGRRPSSRRAR